MFFKKKNHPSEQEELADAGSKQHVSSEKPTQNMIATEEPQIGFIDTPTTESKSVSLEEPKTDAEESKADSRSTSGVPDQDVVYPSGTTIAFITFALCLSVFLVALVCYYRWPVQVV